VQPKEEAIQVKRQPEGLTVTEEQLKAE